MARTIEEWIGATDDTPVPTRVRNRLYVACGGVCAICTRKIPVGDRWVADHVKALINGGANRETNLQIICDWCDRRVKTPADVAEKSKVYAVQTKHFGSATEKRGFGDYCRGLDGQIKLTARARRRAEREGPTPAARREGRG